MSNFNIEVPISSLSFGQVGYGVLVELFRQGLKPNIFPIGNVDLKSFLIPPGFVEWLTECVEKADTEFSENDPTISLWHIQGSHKRISKKNILWTAHETSELTDTEVNVLSKFDKVLTTSNYSKEIFSKRISNVDWCPNFYDDLHFFKTNRQYRNSDDVITFGLFGKMEHRKHTINILVAWANLFAGKKEYRLNCCIYNPFVPVDIQSKQVGQVFRGNIPWNINILPFQEKNIDFNQVMNSIDIDLSGLSGAEGFGLPCFHSLCLGKQSVILNAHAHKDYADSSNSILIEPSGQKEIYDGQFFRKGYKYNQGMLFSFNEVAASDGMKLALEKAKVNNDAGELLKDKFSVQNTVKILLNNI